jgi:hypothetical protein
VKNPDSRAGPEMIFFVLVAVIPVNPAIQFHDNKSPHEHTIPIKNYEETIQSL